MAHAGSLFFSSSGEKETLYSRIVPCAEQTDFLRARWNPLADWLTADLQERSGFTIRTWLQGSYKFGTVIRPVGPSEEYDVDLGIYFCWDSAEQSTPAPSQLREWIQASLLGYGQRQGSEVRQVAQPPKERCSRAHFEKQFHIDIPGYHLDEKADARRLATLSKGWETSDPKALYVWFKDKVGNPERTQLRRVVRYLKAWAALTFPEASGARPSSVMLTVLATEAFVKTNREGADDEDAFCAIAQDINQRMHQSSKVPNPVDRAEDLNRCSDEVLGHLLDELEELDDVCGRALAAENAGSAAVLWDEAFGHLMPLPEEDASVQFQGADGTALVALPVIDVDVCDSNGRVLKTYRDEVPQVDKQHRLRFRIVNPAVVPQWATVDWVVRNAGEEAIARGDLGHSKRGARALECEERTAYNGRHFMDCIIRVGGKAITVKRVPVYIRAPGFNKVLPKKPWYRRFARRR